MVYNFTHQSPPLVTPITHPTIIYHTHTTKGIILPPSPKGFHASGPPPQAATETTLHKPKAAGK